MGHMIRLNVLGLERLSANTHGEIVFSLRQTMGPLVQEAGKTLSITRGPHRGDLNLEFDSDTDTTSSMGICKGGISLLGEDAGEVVFVRATKELRVCGPQRDPRKFLTASWLLGPALANTGIHELGHFIANLEHVNDSMNFMSTMGPPQEGRTIATQREFWAGRKTFTPAQKERLIARFKDEQWQGGMVVTPGP